MKRGILWVIWGDKHRAYLERSIASVRATNPSLNAYVVELEPTATLHDKARLVDWTPFDSTLYLDLDTVVLGSLDYGFEQAERHGMAVRICEQPWARRYKCFRHRYDMQDYNSGVLFWGPAGKPVMEAWKNVMPSLDTSLTYVHKDTGERRVQPYADQAGLAYAIDKLEFNPFGLNPCWNFRPMFDDYWFGGIRVWHSYEDVPELPDPDDFETVYRFRR